MRKLIVPLLAASLLPGACAQRDSAAAEAGSQRLVGLRSDDLRLCAGVPHRTATSEGGEFWTYDRSPPATGVSVPVPVMGGAVNLSQASSCSVNFQLVDQRVTRVRFTGSSDMPMARNSACAPIIQSCLRLLDSGSARPR